MSIISKLASSLNRRDEQVADNNNKKAIQDLLIISATKTKTFKTIALKFSMKSEKENLH